MDWKRLLATMTVMAGLISCLGVRPSSSTQEVIRLVTNYPNPFDSRSGSTTIVYNLAVDSTVKIRIYDLLGNQVREYPAVQEPAGLQQLVWDGTDDDNRKVAKGGYICAVTITSAEVRYVASRKIGVIH